MATTIRLLLVAAVALPVAIIALEIGLQLYVRATAATVTVPAVSEFAIELHASTINMRQNDDGSVSNPDYHGQFFNVVNNRRVTVGQPDNAPHTIWLYGASTVYDQDVSDADTIASDLQRLVAPEYIVQNMGAIAFGAFQESRYIRATPIKPGDVVLMYDGINDAFSSMIILKNRRKLEPTLCHTLLDHVSWSILVQAVCAGSDDYPVPFDAGLTQKTYQDFVRDITSVRDYTIAHGAYFLHIMQPTVYAAALTSTERGFAHESQLYADTWPLFSGAPYTLDLTHVLDAERARGVELFHSEVHVGVEGDRLIARAIYAALRPSF